MFSADWSLSERVHAPMREQVEIPVSDGITLSAVITRPESGGPVPAIVAAHAYSSEDQFMPMRPPGALRNYLNWNRPRKLTIGPPVYLDRP